MALLQNYAPAGKTIPVAASTMEGLPDEVVPHTGIIRCNKTPPVSFCGTGSKNATVVDCNASTRTSTTLVVSASTAIMPSAGSGKRLDVGSTTALLPTLHYDSLDDEAEQFNISNEDE